MRYLVISDIHANLAALEAVLAAAEPFDAVWCLGDIVGYGPQPNECVERVQSLPGLLCVAGNHDWGALGKLSLADFNSEARRAAEWTGRQLTPANRAWLDGLPERIEHGDLTLVHGSPRHHIWEYILGGVAAGECFAHFRTLGCLVGHSHVPLAFQEPPRPHAEAPMRVLGSGASVSYRPIRAIINPGSVGQPRDSDPRASYALLDPESATIECHREPYPIEETQERMHDAGLPPRLAARLSYGL